MIWLKILSLLGKARQAISHFFGWLFQDWRRIIMAVMSVGLIFMLWQNGALKNDVAKAHNQIAAEKDRTAMAKTAFVNMRNQYQDFAQEVAQKQKQAAAQDAANVRRVAREFANINERTNQDYENALDDSHIALKRLRERLQIATEDRGERQQSDLPHDYSAECAAFGAADCALFFAALPDQFAAAEDNSEKLIALQNYVRAILQININGDDEPSPEN